MYRVIKFFTDLQDSSHPYNVGDAFPRDGLAVSAARYKELAGANNKQGVPLIEKVAEEPVEEEAETGEPVEEQDDDKEQPIEEIKVSKSKKGRKED